MRGILFFLNFLLEMYLMLALATGMLLSLSSLEVTLLPLSLSCSYMYKHHRFFNKILSV
jgi:hypothetical protein